MSKLDRPQDDVLDGPIDGEAQLALALAAARAGGEIVRAAFDQRDDVNAQVHAREKGPGDWVTAIDTASERAIRAVLTEGTPAFPVVGEEEGGERASLEWVVDPLDGTANFVHGFPVVGVSIALVCEGVPVVGVVLAPMLGDCYTARAGSGAQRNGTPLRVSARPVDRAICATGFPFRKQRAGLDEYLPVFHAALRSTEDLRRAGSASLDLAWTAAGVLDGYFERSLGPWDVAAGVLLVREAGGVVTDWSGDDRDWYRSGDVVAGAPAVHAHLLTLTEHA